MPIHGIAAPSGPGPLAWLSEAPLFFALELDTFQPGGIAAPSPAEGHGTAPHGALTELGSPIETPYTITASDTGYRTSPAGGAAVVVYPARLNAAFAIDRRLELDPTASSISESWGSITLLNANRCYDQIGAVNNSDARGVRIYAGRKVIDTARNILLDPDYSTLVPVFNGLAQTWTLDETSLTIPLSDPALWLQTPLQSTFYGGTGGLDGPVALKGVPKPKARGGTAGAPIKNVTPILVDPVNLIYQYSDGPGTVVTLYEGGDGTNILPQGDVANLYSGSTTAGEYRTCNALGLFQLGSPPASGRVITVDITGAFPVAGVVTSPIMIARYLLTEDAGVPTAYINAAAFTAADAACAVGAGVWFGADATLLASSAVDTVLASAGARLMSSRTGTLSPYLLRAIPNGTTPAVTFSPDNAISLAVLALPSTVDPPTAVIKVGYQHNYTVQTTNLSPNATQTQVSYLAQADLFGAFSSSTVLTNYRRPNFPAPIVGAITNQTDATTIANALGALWGTRRRLYQIEVPLALALAYDIGQVVSVVWPVDNLAGGQLGQIVGEQIRSIDNPTSTFLVLV